MDGEDAEETQSLLQAQEQEHRSTQRYPINVFVRHFARGNEIFLYSQVITEGLTYLLSWDNNDGFHWLHIGRCCKHRNYRDCIS